MLQNLRIKSKNGRNLSTRIALDNYTKVSLPLYSRSVDYRINQLKQELLK
jgi:hypothetical protein